MTPRQGPLAGFGLVAAPPTQVGSLARELSAGRGHGDAGQGDAAALLGEDTKWSLDGEGKREYTNPTKAYTYIGHGAGSFEPIPLQPSLWQKLLVRCTAVILCAVFVVGTVGLGLVDWAPAMRHPAATPTFDCKEHYGNRTALWTQEQKAWCCTQVHQGCSHVNATTSPPSAAAATTTLTPALGASSTLPSQPAEACNSTCTYGGEAYTCQERIVFAATHHPFAATNRSGSAALTDHCEKARDVVAKDCSACSTCPLEQPLCVAALHAAMALEHDCDTDYLRWKAAWSTDRQAWCCEHRSRACGRIDPTRPPRRDVAVPL